MISNIIKSIPKIEKIILTRYKNNSIIITPKIYNQYIKNFDGIIDIYTHKNKYSYLISNFKIIDISKIRNL